MRIVPPRRHVETPINLSGRAADAIAFEEAYARVVAVTGAAATEYMNALADVAAAGVQPWQLRRLAGVLATPPEVLRNNLVPPLPRRKYFTSSEAPYAPPEEV